jgi:hypothetical protein
LKQPGRIIEYGIPFGSEDIGRFGDLAGEVQRPAKLSPEARRRPIADT